jgi:hypothetical protein
MAVLWLPAETAGDSGRLHKTGLPLLPSEFCSETRKVTVLNAHGAALKPQQSVRAGKRTEAGEIS